MWNNLGTNRTSRKVKLVGLDEIQKDRRNFARVEQRKWAFGKVQVPEQCDQTEYPARVPAHPTPVLAELNELTRAKLWKIINTKISRRRQQTITDRMLKAWRTGVNDRQTTTRNAFRNSNSVVNRFFCQCFCRKFERRRHVQPPKSSFLIASCRVIRPGTGPWIITIV